MRSPLEIRYRFGPLERRGWIGALRPGQLAILSTAVFLTILAVQALKSGVGLFLGVLILSFGALLTFVPLYGRPLNEWVPVIGVFMARKATGRSRFRSRAPEAGTRFAGGDEAVKLPDSIGRVELLAFPFRGVELGVLADRTNHTFSAVIQARARSFVLLDPVDKAHRLAGWAGVIAGLAREGSPISRVQWIERTAPDDPDALSRYLREAIDPSIGLDALPLQSYLRLTHAAAPVTEQHELYIVLQVNASKAGRAIKQAGGKDTGACMVLARELETMARRLESAEVEVLHALGPRRLAATIRLSYDPHARANLARLDSVDPNRSGVSPRNAWPMRAEEHWSYYRTNDVVHATYWIAEWPRIDVGPDFLAPLLVQTRSMRTVAVTMEPVPPLKAMRAVGFAKTAEPGRRREPPRAGARRRPRRRPLLRLHHRHRRQPRSPRRSHRRGRARRRPVPPGTPALRRRTGTHLLLHAANGPRPEMRIKPRRPAHRVTTAHLQAAYPFISEGGLGSEGVYIGRDVFGGSFCYDAWSLYGKEITGPNMLVIGQIGYAKSSLVKTFLWRQLLFGRTAWVIDPKGEYDALAAMCGVEPIRFASGGSLRLNPLDPMIGGDAQLALLRSISGVMLGRNLRPEEDACLERAHDEAVVEAARRNSQPIIPQVVNRLLEPSDATAHELRTSTVRLAEDGRQLALSLRRMGAGDLRGMFDGPTSPGLDLSGRLVVFNLREVKDEARPILMACTAAWLQGSWARNDGVRRIVVLDEAWVVLRHLAIARWLRESWKLARQYGVQNIAVMHRLSDLTAAGDSGSEQVQLAKGLLEDSETRVIYRQSPGEVEQARELLGLTQTEVEQIPMLERGEALWRVGRRSFIVQHRIDPLLEREIVDTDANMGPRSAPWITAEADEAVDSAS
jgi:hypothetical protein